MLKDKADLRVLILDDEPFMLKLIARILGNLGYTRVNAFDNGAQALEQIDGDDGSPDVILCDLNMPEMDGVEFVRKLVERRYSGNLILVSGVDERLLEAAEKLVRRHKIRILGRLHKPVRPEALSALLDKAAPQGRGRTLLEKKQYAAEEIRTALANNEFCNHYQPQVEVATGRVAGMEALVRWLHPEDGMVYPDQFVGVAEEHGLIDELTRVVLTRALSRVRAWGEEGLAVRMAVNISMNSLQSLDFVQLVVGHAAAAGVAPGSIVLEVTESQLMKDLLTPLEVLTRLRLKGFGLSVDDFGTGHSSLAQLRDMPFEELKVDRGFVHGAWNNGTIRAIYEASLSLGRRLGMGVVAEGVEDLEDWDFLNRTKCPLAQGYFIARPMPAEAVLGWHESWKTRAGERGPILSRGE